MYIAKIILAANAVTAVSMTGCECFLSKTPRFHWFSLNYLFLPLFINLSLFISLLFPTISYFSIHFFYSLSCSWFLDLISLYPFFLSSYLPLFVCYFSISYSILSPSLSLSLLFLFIFKEEKYLHFLLHFLMQCTVLN